MVGKSDRKELLESPWGAELQEEREKPWSSELGIFRPGNEEKGGAGGALLSPEGMPKNPIAHSRSKLKIPCPLDAPGVAAPVLGSVRSPSIPILLVLSRIPAEFLSFFTRTFTSQTKQVLFPHSPGSLFIGFVTRTRQQCQRCPCGLMRWHWGHFASS